MKDLRLPAAVTIPAAIGLVGVLWLLRRKSGSGDGKKSTDKAVQEDNEGTAESNSLSDFCGEQIENRQTLGMIDPQQKLSESLTCDSGTSGLHMESFCSLESSVCQVTLGLGKPIVGSYRHFNEPHQNDGPVAEIEQHGQVENVVSDSVCQNWQVNNSVSTGLIQPEQTGSLAVSSSTSSDLAVSSSTSSDLAVSSSTSSDLAVSSSTSSDLAVAVSDAQITLSDGVMGDETCVEGKGLPSAIVDKNGQSYDITEHGQGDGLLPESNIHNGECVGGLTPTDVAQEGGLVLSDAAEEDHCGTLTSPVTANDGSSLVSFDTTLDVQQCDQSSPPVAAVLQQEVGLDEQHDAHKRDQSSPSAVSEALRDDGLDEQRGVQQHDQSSPSVASEVQQASEVSHEDDFDHQLDVQGHDQVSHSVALEDQQKDGLDDHCDVQRQDPISPSVASEVQQVPEVRQASEVSQEDGLDHESSPSVASEVEQEDDLVASDAHQDDHYDSLISSNGQQDSQYGSLWSSYGQLEGNSDSLMSSVVQQDDQCDSMMSSDNTQDSEFGSQISLDAAMPVGPSNASITEFDQGDRLTTLQKAYIEQQVVTAMGDGLDEACKLLLKSPAQSESSAKQMPVEAAILDDFSRSGSADVSGETEHRVEKCGDSDGKSVLIVDDTQEDDQDITGPTYDLQSEETAGVQSYAELHEDLVCLDTEASVPESSESHNTESLRSADSECLESPGNELFVSTAVVCLESANTESLGSANVESLESAKAESLELATTESLEPVTAESLKPAHTESLVSASTESLQPTSLGPLQSSNTESFKSANTESSELAKTESLEPATTESLKPANTESLDSANIESLESIKTKSLEPAISESLESFYTAAEIESLESPSTESLESASSESLEPTNLGPLQTSNTESLKSANTESSELAETESLEPATTESLESAETKSFKSANTESLVSASVKSLEPTSIGPLQSSNTESLKSGNSEFLASAGTETLESAVSGRDFENANPAVIQEGAQSVQEALITVKPGSDSSPSTGSLPHEPTASEDLLQNSPARDGKQSEQHNKDLSKDNSSSATSKSDAPTNDISVKTIQSKSNSSDTCIQNLPSEQVEARKAFSWLPKASSSSVDSFGPEEIEALWGIESSMMNLEAELTFLDTDPAAVPVGGKGVVEAKGDLGAQLEVPAAVGFGGKDNVAGAASSGSLNDTGCDVSDPKVKDGALGKSISPVCDNNSEGSNDSGRGGSEHDMVCQGGDVPVHFNFCMPSDLCGQFIGKHGKNINYLKSRSGAHVTLTSSAFTPEYQICQIMGTQAEVDDALSMIRRKFPLQDYPHLTMDPVDMSVPLPLVPDGQVVYPEVMQLSLPEGVSVEVFVSAVVDAGQVFVQQPTHRSYMSLEKMNYFLNLVYSQDPNVPSVPLPIESGVICVCESEGYWYRAMIMSPVDENGEVQLKFVDYGGYITLPVASLKQIRVDFMNLPFQAVECFMANITPNQGEKLFSDEATQALCDLTQGKLLQCQVVARTEYGIPYIHLYQVNTERNSAVLINRALVNRRLVRWIEIL